MVRCSYCGKEGKHQLKNGKWCCSKNYQSCPALRKKNSDKKKINYVLPKNNANTIRVKCKHCGKDVGLPGLKRHEKTCYLNPFNISFCPICDTPIKNYKKSKTCSYSCSNKFNRRGIVLTNTEPTNYRTICFNHHIKKCVVCNETLILAVHHYDENKQNNSPENLVPLCPTHHAYMHSGYKYLIKDKIEKYVNNYIETIKKKELNNV